MNLASFHRLALASLLVLPAEFVWLRRNARRHIALLCRSEIPPRNRWALLPHDDKHQAIIDTIRKIEHLGAQVTTASVDITDAGQVQTWLSKHIEDGGRPVRGVVQAGRRRIAPPAGFRLSRLASGAVPGIVTNA